MGISEAWEETFGGAEGEGYRRLVDLSPDACFVYSDDRTVFVNAAGVRLLGAERADQILGRSPSEFVHRSQRLAARAAMAALAERGTPMPPPWTLVRLDRTKRDVEVSATAFPLGSRVAIGAIMRDVTDRRRVDRALRRSEELLVSFLRNVPGAAFIKDAKGRYVMVNERFEKIRRARRGSWIGRTDADIFPPEVAAALAASDDAVRSSGKAVQVVEETPQEDGPHKWLVSKFPIPGDGDAPPMLGGIGFDITSRVRAEEERMRLHDEVVAARGRLETLSRRLLEVQEIERRRIARELHDEVGQLLTGLKLRLEVNDAAQHGTETREIVNDVMSRVRDLSMNLMPPMLDDLGLLPALMWQIERYTAQTKIRVDFRHAGIDRRFPREVELAAFRIAQEGLTNVARHTDVAEARLEVWANAESVGVQVVDEGVGFDAESASAGPSVGLPGIRERVRLAGGRFSVDSATGEGTRLTAVLPLGGAADGGG